MSFKNFLKEYVENEIAIVEESTDSLSFNDLEPIEVGALIAIDDGRLDFENATDRMMDVLDILQGYGLLDRFFELTDTGKKAVELGRRYGSKTKRDARVMQQYKDKEADKDAKRDTEIAMDSEFYD